MKPIRIVHIYPQEMNIYGDTGNVLILRKRLEWRGIPVVIKKVGIGDTIPADTDLIIGGGGQDDGQAKVEQDLHKKAAAIAAMVSDGVPMLMICGMYQLFGNAFITKEDKTIKGIGVLPMFTQASDQRMIGNIVVQSEWGELVGYENHSGKTYLDNDCLPLGRVISGCGNNGEDKTEGARINNVFGSYCHGPMLSKNPRFADELLNITAKRKGIELQPLDDKLEQKAALIAANRPR